MDWVKSVASGVAESASESWKSLGGTDIERKVKEATSNENWGTSGTSKTEIADATRDYTQFREIFNLLWKRVGEKETNWRMVFKTLDLLDFLLKHGHHRCVDEIRDHTITLRPLMAFSFIDPANGQDRGRGVREMSKRIVDLVQDTRRLEKARAGASSTKSKMKSIGSTGFGSTTGGSGGGGFNSSYVGSAKSYSSDTYRKPAARHKAWTDDTETTSAKKKKKKASAKKKASKKKGRTKKKKAADEWDDWEDDDEDSETAEDSESDSDDTRRRKKKKKSKKGSKKKAAAKKKKKPKKKKRGAAKPIKKYESDQSEDDDDSFSFGSSDDFAEVQVSGKKKGARGMKLSTPVGGGTLTALAPPPGGGVHATKKQPHADDGFGDPFFDESDFGTTTAVPAATGAVAPVAATGMRTVPEDDFFSTGFGFDSGAPSHMAAAPPMAAPPLATVAPVATGEADFDWMSGGGGTDFLSGGAPVTATVAPVTSGIGDLFGPTPTTATAPATSGGPTTTTVTTLSGKVITKVVETKTTVATTKAPEKSGFGSLVNLDDLSSTAASKPVTTTAPGGHGFMSMSSFSSTTPISLTGFAQPPAGYGAPMTGGAPPMGAPMGGAPAGYGMYGAPPPGYGAPMGGPPMGRRPPMGGGYGAPPAGAYGGYPPQGGFPQQRQAPPGGGFGW